MFNKMSNAKYLISKIVFNKVKRSKRRKLSPVVWLLQEIKVFEFLISIP